MKISILSPQDLTSWLEEKQQPPVSITTENPILVTKEKEYFIAELVDERIQIVSYSLGGNFKRLLQGLRNTLSDDWDIFILPRESDAKEILKKGFKSIPNEYFLQYDPPHTWLARLGSLIKSYLGH